MSVHPPFSFALSRGLLTCLLILVVLLPAHAQYEHHADGTLWAWGLNFDYALGDGTMTTRTVPVQIGTETTWKSINAGSYHSLAIRQDGTLRVWGHNGSGHLGNGTSDNVMPPTQLGTATTWHSVSGGDTYNVALRQDGSLWAWGTNNYGQLGDGTTKTSYVPKQSGMATWQSIAARLGHTPVMALSPCWFIR